MKLKTLKSKLVVLMSAMVVMSGMVIPVSASEVENQNTGLIVDNEGSGGDMPWIPLDKADEVSKEYLGSISITLTPGKQGTSLEGVEFACSRVADFEDGEFQLLEEYKDANVDLNGIQNSKDLEEAAKSLSKVVKKGRVGTTDANGKLSYKDLEVGVYLLRTTKAFNYDDVTPLLVSIPTWDEKGGDVLYDVDVIPKHTPKPDVPEVPKQAPQTNVNSPIVYYFVGAGAVLVILIVGNVIFRKKRK